MRVGVIQSNYIPWRGYFDFIRSVDLFIIHDDVQYTKQDWRNRNRIKRWPSGTQWIAVPVKHGGSDQLICDAEIDYSTNWRHDHLNMFRAAYDKCQFYREAQTILEGAFSWSDVKISTLNIRIILAVCSYFGIKTPIITSMELDLPGLKNEKLLNLLKKVGATEYLSGPMAKHYIDEDLFEQNGIKLEYKTYNYYPYEQPWGNFDGAVTVLDLIACCGPETANLASFTPNVIR